MSAAVLVCVENVIVRVCLFVCSTITARSRLSLFVYVLSTVFVLRTNVTLKHGHETLLGANTPQPLLNHHSHVSPPSPPPHTQPQASSQSRTSRLCSLYYIEVYSFKIKTQFFYFLTYCSQYRENIK